MAGVVDEGDSRSDANLPFRSDLFLTVMAHSVHGSSPRSLVSGNGVFVTVQHRLCASSARNLEGSGREGQIPVQCDQG